jgi:alkanesulfonate monooxygenase SsuD/methylene tetrahydromethanopterin reductase-like flavin-dependent oxidoreductase (luciferase family)
MAYEIELGLDTFGDVTSGPDGSPLSHAEVIRDIVEEGVLADDLGIHAFGVGEHHRPDFAISAPEVVLAVIAGRTTRMRLASAVTVLSSDDPIRVFQRFSTLNAASRGRAEAILGRGSFTESFPLFGYDLRQYEVLFEEKLDLFAAIRWANPSPGAARPALPLTGSASPHPSRPGSLPPGSVSAARRIRFSGPCATTYP